MPKRTQTLRSRLTTLVIVAIFGAVGIATASSVWRETAQFGAGDRAELSATANIFAAVIAKPVMDRDQQSAEAALQAAARVPGFQYVRVDSEDGSLFAALGNPDLASRNPAADPEGDSWMSFLTSNSADTTAPILHNGETIGALTLYIEKHSLAEQIGILLYDALVAAIF
ncbi:MAG: CHASE sensor domain-containing protein, partial [Pseudomonadota bacterium]